MSTSATIVLAFDHPVVRAGLRAVLAGEPFEVVAECVSVRQVLDTCRGLQPTLLVTDVILETKDIYEVLAKLPTVSPTTKTLLLAPVPEPIWVARAVAWGAQDFLLRSASREEILTSLQRARDGLPTVDGSRLHKMNELMQRRTDFPKSIPPTTMDSSGSLREPAWDRGANRDNPTGQNGVVRSANQHRIAERSTTLTGREMQTLRLLGLGLSNQEIARTIHVRLETAKEHVLNAMRKLDVADRTQAAVTAIQNGWLS